MDKQTGDAEFDAIVVGSGPGGATVARELSRRGRRVLILERGGNKPLKDTLLGIMSIMDAVKVGDGLITARALTTGGTTSVYLASTVPPPLETFQALGIDLSGDLAETEKELPLAILPDACLRPHSLRIRESAIALGYPWRTALMLVDQTKCSSGYDFESKWTARSYVQEAVENGAILISQARALRVLVEDGRAVGVEYELRKSKKNVEIRQVFGSKIILAAGGATTPIILRRSGVRNIADQGFYCHPSFLVFGTISGLNGRDGFGGTGGLTLDGGIHVGDGNFDRTFYRLIMLGQQKWIRALSYSRNIGMGVTVRDSLGGALSEDGRYHKQLTKEDYAKLAKGEEVARQIIEHAGGRNLFVSPLSGALVGGMVRINEHVDENLETEYRNLHVCDGAVLPLNVNAPTLTLICMGKYLARHLTRAA